MILRILASVILLFSMLFMPLWVTAILALAGIIYFSVFWEAIVLFFLSDLLYGTNEAKFNDVFFITFFISLIVLILMEFLKKKLRFYS